jgi:hypothetical protein
MELTIIGAWLATVGYVAEEERLIRLGHAAALAGGLVFVSNLLRLFRQQPGHAPAPPLPYPDQAAVDRAAIQFTRLSGLFLLTGLVVGVLTSWWQPESGRWNLVWAHAMLVGFFLSMASGVCYHVLARWTGRRWRAVAPIRLHLLTVAIGLPSMLLALATGRDGLFAVAGPLQAAAVLFFLVNIAAMLPGLPILTRTAMTAAGILLAAGVTLGALFALEPALGARLRLVHAELNLFGWTGLLIAGVGYYLFPRLLGRPLQWPVAAWAQIGCLGSGVLLCATALAFRAYGHGPAGLVALGHAIVAAGFLLFGLIIGRTATFQPGPAIVTPVSIQRMRSAERPTPVLKRRDFHV